MKKKYAYQSASDYARKMGVDKATVARWCKDGKIRAVKNDVGSRWLIETGQEPKFRPIFKYSIKPDEKAYRAQKRLIGSGAFTKSELDTMIENTFLSGHEPATRFYVQEVVEKSADKLYGRIYENVNQLRNEYVYGRRAVIAAFVVLFAVALWH